MSEPDPEVDWLWVEMRAASLAAESRTHYYIPSSTVDELRGWYMGSDHIIATNRLDSCTIHEMGRSPQANWIRKDCQAKLLDQPANAQQWAGWLAYLITSDLDRA